jgi:signal transduction histidine kinase
MGHRGSNLAHRALLLAGISVAVIVGIVANRIWQSYQAAFDAAGRSQMHTVRLLETSAAATLQSVEIILDRVVAQLDGQVGPRPDAEALTRRFARIAEPWDFVFGITYAGRDGVFRAMSRREADGHHHPRITPIDRSRDAVFTVHRDGRVPLGQVFISDPFQGWLSGEWLIAVTKAVRGRDGSFDGVAAVTVSLDSFAKLFVGMVPENFAALGLFKADGTMLISMPTNTRVGYSYGESELFRRIAAGESAGVYRLRHQADQQDRLVAYRVAARYPFAIAFSVGDETVLESWQRESLAMATAAGGGVLMILALTWWLLRQIAAEQRAQAAVRENEQRLGDLLDVSSDFIWETDVRGIVTTFAGQGSERFPLPVGLHASAMDAPEAGVDAGDLAAFRRALADRESFRNLVIPRRGLNDEVRWIRASGKPLFAADGTFMGYRGAGADVTETLRQRQIDEERRKAEALGRLASGIAHEINNLLQPIIIYAAFGSGEDGASDGHKRYFSRIGRAAEAATHILRNVLSFARQRPPHKQPVVLADAVRETVDLVGDALPAGIARVVGPMTPDLVVEVDRSGLAQALTNLITNAAEAMPDGGTITIAAEECVLAAEEAKAIGLGPGTYARLSVVDTGPGIAPDQIDKVFDPFFTTKPQGKGTGLGLSVVAGHAKSWGGVATVANAPGAGTTFAVYLPLVRREMLAAQ